YVEGDRTRLHQVLGNLLSNSLKFCNEGGRVRLRAVLDTGAREVVLGVVDDGIGIDQTLLPTLFEPFTQGPASAGRSNGGLGLGLALVKSLVDLHGGRVEARSDGPGRGAEVIVRLPVAAERQL